MSNCGLPSQTWLFDTRVERQGYSPGVEKGCPRLLLGSVVESATPDLVVPPLLFKRRRVSSANQARADSESAASE